MAFREQALIEGIYLRKSKIAISVIRDINKHNVGHDDGYMNVKDI